MQRRTLLGLGVAGSLVVAALGGGASLALRAPAWHRGDLSPAGHEVFHAIARAVLDGSLPAAGTRAHAQSLDAHMQRLTTAIRALPTSTQSQIGELVSLLATALGRRAIAGLHTDWPDAPAEAVQAALQAMRTSRLTLRRQAYHALRDLTHGAYFADAATWPLLGYPGPNPIPTS